MERDYKGFLPVKSRIEPANPALADYKSDIPGFFQNILGITLTPDQIRVCESLQTNQVTAVPSAHGMGKTCLGAGLILWWVFVKQGQAISTAPTARQVNKLLWGELRRFYDSYPFGGHRDKCQVMLDEYAHAFGFTASPHQGSDSFQGIHSNRGLLIVIDEANGILPTILEGAESCITGTHDKLLLIGNPTSPGTPFEKLSKRRRGVVRIPAWGHPNIAWAYRKDSNGIHRLKPEVAARIMRDGELLPEEEWPAEYRDKVKIPGAVSIRWIETVARPKGEDSAYWKGRVEAVFPEDATNSLIPRSWFEQARTRYENEKEEWDNVSLTFAYRWGLDVADGGDNHALAAFRGPLLKFAETRPSQGDRKDVSRAAAWGLQHLRANRGGIAVDNIGVGAGALSEVLNNLPQACTAAPCNFASKPRKPITFYNRKAELFWTLREAFQRGEIAIDLPDDVAEVLCDELSGLRYEILPSGKIKMEDKEEFKKRYGHSPDMADAVANAWSLPAVSSVEARNAKPVGGQRVSSRVVDGW